MADAVTADRLQKVEVSRATAIEAYAVVAAASAATATRVAIAGREATSAGVDDAISEHLEAWVAGGFGTSVEFFAEVQKMSDAQMLEHGDNMAAAPYHLMPLVNGPA